MHKLSLLIEFGSMKMAHRFGLNLGPNLTSAFMDAKSIPVRISERWQFANKINARNNNNLVQLKYAPIPSSPPPFAMFLCNARSVRCMAAQLRNFIIDNDIDILVITDT